MNNFDDKQRIQIEQRLLKRTVKHKNGCWICNYEPGAKYPRMGIKYEKYFTHRLAFELWRDPIPEGMCVLHRCDVPRCINPDHLWLGTKTDNAKDRDNKGRQAKGERNGAYTHPEKINRGEKHGCAKLTEEDVRYIRMWRGEGFSSIAIAKAFNVHQTTIERVISGRKWKHVPNLESLK